jgi:hypothetical protein
MTAWARYKPFVSYLLKEMTPDDLIHNNSTETRNGQEPPAAAPALPIFASAISARPHHILEASQAQCGATLTAGVTLTAGQVYGAIGM